MMSIVRAASPTGWSGSRAEWDNPVQDGQSSSVQRETERNGPEKVSFRIDNVQLPSAPILNNATGLSLQFDHGHDCLSLSVLKIRDFNALFINQLSMIMNEVEVAAHS